MSRRISRRSADPGESVDLSPLIDMTFLLLIFFVVSSTLVDDVEIPIERPAAGTGEQVEDRTVRVALTASGQVAVEGETAPIWMVEARVRHVLDGHPTRRVLVVVDRGVDVARLVDVVDQCRLGGASHVGVAVNEAP